MKDAQMQRETAGDDSDADASGQFYCLKCGRRHNRSSDIGAYHHYKFDVEREGFDPETVAVGIAHVNATRGRRRPEATIDEIAGEFADLGFAEQFPGVEVGETVRDWKDRGLIADGRHSGRHWFLFLANRRTPRGEERSPWSFHLWMKDYASEFRRARKR